VWRPWRNSLAATVIRVTGGAQIRHFVMAITGCRQAARRIPAQSDEWSGYPTITTDRLRDDELEGVTGGLVVVSIIGILVGLLLPAANSYADAKAPSDIRPEPRCAADPHSRHVFRGWITIALRFKRGTVVRPPPNSY
jgi:hypothetical protein